MAKYRLLTKHYMQDQLLDEGTIVGEGTSFNITDEMVSPDMEGLDDESREKVQKAKEEQTKPMMAAPQIGMLYLEPEVRNALVDAAKRQQGADPEYKPPTSQTREGQIPHPKEPDRPQGTQQPEPKEGAKTQLPNPPPVSGQKK